MAQRRKPHTAIQNIPESLALISFRGYENALSFHREGNAFLAALQKEGRPPLQISPDDGSLCKEASAPIRPEELNQYFDGNINGYDLKIMAALFTLVQGSYGDGSQKGYQIYLPDLMRMMGKRSNLSRPFILSFVHEHVLPLQALVGAIDGKVYPVFPRLTYDEETNCLLAHVPYFMGLIKKFNCIDKPTYSYLVKTTALAKCNADEFESLRIICTVIEQAGRKPHISAETILQRNLFLQSRLEHCLPNNRQKVVKQSFQTVLKLLKEETRLCERYMGLSLPNAEDKANIPNINQMGKSVFKFSNYGKRR